MKLRRWRAEANVGTEGWLHVGNGCSQCYWAVSLDVRLALVLKGREGATSILGIVQKALLCVLQACASMRETFDR